MKWGALLSVAACCSAGLQCVHTFGPGVSAPAAQAFQRHASVGSGAPSAAHRTPRDGSHWPAFRLGEPPRATDCTSVRQACKCLLACARGARGVDRSLWTCAGRRSARVALRSSKWQDRGQHTNASAYPSDVHVTSHAAVPFTRIADAEVHRARGAWVLRVYVCMCVVCMCVRVYVCMCVRVYVCTYVRVYVCTCVRVYVCTCVRVYVCTCVRVYVHVCMCCVLLLPRTSRHMCM